MTTDTILNKLDSLRLSQLDKRRLRDALDVELTGSAGEYTDMEQAVWDAVTHVLHIRMPLDTFLTRTKYGKRAFANDVHQIEQFVTAVCERLTKIERRSVLATVMRCMVLYLSEGNEAARISPQKLMESIYLVDQAVEDQYPGYLEAGLLRNVMINAPIG
jgi:hypothetical protein